MAKGCLQILVGQLRFNICGVDDTSLLNEEIPDLESRILQYIHPHLQYACRHWAHHTTNAEIDEDLLDLVTQFSERSLLDWLSALSILGSMDITVDALQTSRRALQVSIAIHGYLCATYLMMISECVISATTGYGHPVAL